MFHNVIFIFLMCLYLVKCINTFEKKKVHKLFCKNKSLQDIWYVAVVHSHSSSFLVKRELAFLRSLIFIRIKILSRIFSSQGILSQHVCVINMLFLVRNDINFPVSYQSKLLLNLQQSDIDLQNQSINLSCYLQKHGMIRAFAQSQYVTRCACFFKKKKIFSPYLKHMCL